jgi:hypothetical protein
MTHTSFFVAVDSAAVVDAASLLPLASASADFISGIRLCVFMFPPA